MTQEFPRPEDLNQVGIIGDDGSKGRAVLVDSGGRILLAANSGVDIGDIDVLSVIPGTGATNLGKAEDAVHVSGDVGVMLLAVRQDAQADFAADGDYVPFSIDADGALRVSGGGGGTQYTEDVAAAANPVGNALILVRTDTPATQVTTDGDNVAQRGTNYGAAYVQLVTSAGAYIDSVGGGTEYTEDVASANPQVGKAIMIERDDALSTVTPIEGDWIGLRGTAEGALWTQDFNSTAILADTANIDTATAAINAKLVTGTVIGDVNLGAVDNAVLDAIAASLAIIDATVFGAGTEAGALRVTLPTDGTGVVKLGAGTAAIGKLAANSGVDIGDVDVTSISAGANLIGNVGIGVRTSGGATPFYNLDVDETEDAIKASAGQLYELYCNNTTAAQLFVKLYDATVANVVVGTTTPVMTIPVPANNDLDGGGVVRSWPMGLVFTAAITIAATTAAADADVGAPAAGALIVSGAYA